MPNYANQKRIEITNTDVIFYNQGKPIRDGFYHTIYYEYVDFNHLIYVFIRAFVYVC